MASSRRAVLGTVVIRAWIEPYADARDVRARVLLIREFDVAPQEVGVAAGLDQLLALVSKAVLALNGYPDD